MPQEIYKNAILVKPGTVVQWKSGDSLTIVFSG